MTQGYKFVRRIISLPGRFSSFVLRLFGDRHPAQLCVIVLGINLLFIALALLLPPAREMPTYYFQGTRLISFVSLVQLIVISALAFQVYLERLGHGVGESCPGNSRNPHSRLLWLVIFLGFFFMAVDEIVSIHVFLDRTINSFGSNNGRIHGVTVSLYTIGAIGVLVFFYQEIVLFRRSWIPFLVAFFCLVASIAFDTMAIYRIEPWLPKFCVIFLTSSGRGVTEESLELFSEVFFITAMYTAVMEARCIGKDLLQGANKDGSERGLKES